MDLWKPNTEALLLFQISQTCGLPKGNNDKYWLNAYKAGKAKTSLKFEWAI